MNKNYRMEEHQEDKGHKRQQSNAIGIHQQQAQVLQPQFQPTVVHNSNATVNFKVLARNGGISNVPTGSTSTTPTNSVMPQSNSSNFTTVNKEVSRVREKRATDEKPMSAVHQQMNFTVNVSNTVTQNRKTDIKLSEKSDF